MKAVETRFSLFICNGKEAVIEKKENGIYLKGRKKKKKHRLLFCWTDTRRSDTTGARLALFPVALECPNRYHNIYKRNDSKCYKSSTFAGLNKSHQKRNVKMANKKWRLQSRQKGHEARAAHPTQHGRCKADQTLSPPRRPSKRTTLISKQISIDFSMSAFVCVCENRNSCDCDGCPSVTWCSSDRSRAVGA